MADILLFTNYRSLALGLKIEVPHEKVTLVTVSVVFWSVMVIIGAKYGGDK